jgi:hypothetical protein
LVDRTGVSNDEGRVTEWDSVCQARIGPNLLLCKGQKPRRSRPLCLAWSNLDLGTLLTFQALTMDTVGTTLMALGRMLSSFMTVLELIVKSDLPWDQMSLMSLPS